MGNFNIFTMPFFLISFILFDPIWFRLDFIWRTGGSSLTYTFISTSYSNIVANKKTSSSLVYPILSSFCTVHTPHWTFNGSSYTPFHSLLLGLLLLLLSISPDRIRNTKSGEKRYPRIGSCDKIRLNPAR